MDESFITAAKGKASAATPPGMKVVTMKVVSSPDQNTALTNKAYSHPDDISFFPERMIYVKDQIVLTVSADPSVDEGCIALNATQRRTIRVSAEEALKVERFIPEQGSELGVLGLDLHFMKFRGKQETIMTVGQMVNFKYLGTNYVFTVKETILKDVAKVSSLGLWVKKTHLQFETLPTSGIKVLSTN